MNRIGKRRISCNVAYLEPARERENLVVRGATHVRRIVIEGGRARGVELVDGEVLRAGEVVSACGVLQSPLLLTRSGIGPGDHLRRLGIEPVVDAPALGERWTDHMAAFFDTPVDPGLVHRGGLGLQAIVRTTCEGSARSHDHQITPFHYRAPDGGIVFSMSISMQQPVGAGHVRATSSDPAARADVDWPFAGEPHNVERMRWAWRTMVRMVEEAGVSLDPEGLRRAGSMSDEALDEHLALEHTAFYHGVGTCAMGDDEGSVVDSECRVRGVSGLRVVDTSVVPTVPRSNTNMLAIALGERVAEWMGVS